MLQSQRIANIVITLPGVVGLVLHIIGHLTQKAELVMVGSPIFALSCMIFFWREPKFRASVASAVGGALKAGLFGIPIAFFMFGVALSIAWMMGLFCIPATFIANLVGWIRNR